MGIVESAPFQKTQGSTAQTVTAAHNAEKEKL
jgi:hypothetical protein